MVLLIAGGGGIVATALGWLRYTSLARAQRRTQPPATRYAGPGQMMPRTRWAQSLRIRSPRR